jgi:hypothetical protein
MNRKWIELFAKTSNFIIWAISFLGLRKTLQLAHHMSWTQTLFS